MLVSHKQLVTKLKTLLVLKSHFQLLYQYIGVKAFVLGIVFLCPNGFILASQQTVYLTDSLVETGVTREKMSFYIDETNQLSVSQILSRYPEFIQTTADDFVNDKLNSNYWIRFDVKNSCTSYRDFILELYDYDIDQVSFYELIANDKPLLLYETGYAYPFKTRQLDHKNIRFTIDINRGDRKSYLMRINSRRFNLLEPIIRYENYAFKYSHKEYIFLGVFYGLVLLIIFYNAVYFIFLRRKHYLYYVLYACGTLIYLLGKSGLGFQYIWPNSPSLNSHMHLVGLCVSTVFMLLFAVEYLDIKDKNPFYVRSFRFAIFSRIVFGDNVLFLFIDFLYIQYIFVVGLISYRNGIVFSKWFIVAYGILNGSFIVAALEVYNVLPSTIFSVYALNIGVVFQFVFLSIGIAEKVKDVYHEKNLFQARMIGQLEENEQLKDKVNRELETKVVERTKELSTTMESLEKVSEENLRMNRELDKINSKLKNHLRDYAREAVTKSYLNFEEFTKAFENDLACKLFLRDLKNEAGFTCKKCKNTKSIKGIDTYDRRCSKCNYNESITANTVFHRCKFSLQKAFYMSYLFSNKIDDLNITEIANLLELQHSTCKTFKVKIEARMKKTKNNKSVNGVSFRLSFLDE